MNPASIFGAVRTLRRARHLIAVLTRFGFSNVISELGLERLWGRGLRLVGRRKESPDLTGMPVPERVRRVLEQLGPTFIKVGQILSTRPDLIPPAWATEFSNLQADIPPEPWERVEPMLRREFPQGLDAVFKSIEPSALAAASMAQVHRAVLVDGQKVVIKVLRPGIRGIVASDMEIIGALASLMQQHFTNLGYDPVAVVTEFERQLVRETDLRLEGQSTDRMRAEYVDNPRINFPRVYWAASTSSVLALEEIEGTLLTRLDVEALSAEQRQRIVRNGTDAVFHQCLDIGFFHADPHPGNIIIQSGERICMIDCGMTGTIDPGTTELLAELVYGAIERDIERVTQVAIELTEAPPAVANGRRFRAEVWKFMHALQVDSLGDVRMGRLMSRFFEVLQDFHLQCPADLMYLIKAMSTIEGVAEAIDPGFDVVGHVRPYIEKLVLRRVGAAALMRRVQKSALGYAEVAEQLPDFMRETFRAVRQNRLSINVEHKRLEGLAENIEHASINISYSLLIASTVIGSSVLLLAGSISNRNWLFWLAGFGFVLSSGLALFRVTVSTLRRR